MEKKEEPMLNVDERGCFRRRARSITWPTHLQISRAKTEKCTKCRMIRNFEGCSRTKANDRWERKNIVQKELQQFQGSETDSEKVQLLRNEKEKLMEESFVMIEKINGRLCCTIRYGTLTQNYQGRTSLKCRKKKRELCEKNCYVNFIEKLFFVEWTKMTVQAGSKTTSNAKMFVVDEGTRTLVDWDWMPASRLKIGTLQQEVRTVLRNLHGVINKLQKGCTGLLSKKIW